MSEVLVTQFLIWTERNRMLCNPGKCKEVTVLKKCNHELYPPIFGIPSCTYVSILGVTFQRDCKFNTHVKNKLVKANKCLYVLRSLRKEGYKQAEIDFLFDTFVLPNFTYALSVYGASESDLTPVQCFLDRCWKSNFTTGNYTIRSILQSRIIVSLKGCVRPSITPCRFLFRVLRPAATIYGRGQASSKHQK